MAAPKHAHPWADLPERTPYVALNLPYARAAYATLRKALPLTKIFFAMKANSTPELLRLMNELGAGFVVASIGELDLLQRSGVETTNDRVSFSNPVKHPDHIAASYALGVRQYTVDSPGELRKLAKYAPGTSESPTRVFYRLETRAGASGVPSEGKFGATPQEILSMLKMTEQLGLMPYGISFHVGSQNTAPSAWAYALSSVADVLDPLYKVPDPFADEEFRGVHKLQMVNMGGGFPVPYIGTKGNLHDITGTIRERIFRLPHGHGIETMIEPGRYLVAEAGVMVATVIGVVRRRDTTWVHTDVGVFNGFMEVLETQGTLWYPVSDSRGGPTHAVNITGPSCDTQDTWRFNVQLSKGLREGDRVYAELAGAYGPVYGSNFNGFPIPRTYVVNTYRPAQLGGPDEPGPSSLRGGAQHVAPAVAPARSRHARR